MPASIAADPDLSVDLPALSVLLDGPHAETRARVREQLASYASVLEDAEEMPYQDFRERVLEVVLELAQTGDMALGFPEEFGGRGDIGAAVAAFETMAFGDLSVLVKTGVQFGLFGGAIQQLGTQRHHEQFLRPLIKGELLGCFAMTETGHGSNVQALATTATYDVGAGEFVIDTPDEQSGKDYIGNAARHGRWAVVFAQLLVGEERHGVHAFVVPIRNDLGEPLAGVRIGDDGRKMGLGGVDNGRLWFSGVRVPREALLNRFADVEEDGTYRSEIQSPGRRFFTMLGTLVQGRVSIAGAGVSAAKTALTIAVEYGLQRRQFDAGGDEPDEEILLLDYGMHQRRLFPLLARTYALSFAQEVLASRLHDVFSGVDGDEASRRQLESRAAGTKALATWHATRTIQKCREACGGAGYLAVNRFAALKADTDVFTTFEGDNHVLLQLVAKGLLTDYASEFSDLDPLAMVGQVAGMAVDAVVEKTRVHQLLERIKDVFPSDDDDEDAGLLDPDYHLAMFRFREEHLIASAARRLKRGVDAGLPAAEVFSTVQDHVIAAGRAHVERLVLEAFVEKCRSLPDGAQRSVLNLLCDLHALSAIEADRGWFIEHGKLSSSRSKAITRQVGELLRRVRPLAGDLVAAFDVPRETLRAEALILQRRP